MLTLELQSEGFDSSGTILANSLDPQAERALLSPPLIQASLLWWAWCCTSPASMMRCSTEPRMQRPISTTNMDGHLPSPPSPSC